MGTDSLYGIDARRISALTGVHLSTARRWKRTRKHPRWVGPFLAMAIGGELEPIGRDWRGWRIRDRRLISPEGFTATPGEILSIQFLKAQVRTYQAQARTHLQADWIDERFVESNMTEVG